MGDTLLGGHKKKKGNWESDLTEVIERGNAHGNASDTH